MSEESRDKLVWDEERRVVHKVERVLPAAVLADNYQTHCGLMVSVAIYSVLSESMYENSVRFGKKCRACFPEIYRTKEPHGAGVGGFVPETGTDPDEPEDVEALRLERDDLRKNMTELLQGFWSLLYPDNPDGYEYRTQPLVHIRVELEQLRQKVADLETVKFDLAGRFRQLQMDAGKAAQLLNVKGPLSERVRAYKRYYSNIILAQDRQIEHLANWIVRLAAKLDPPAELDAQAIMRDRKSHARLMMCGHPVEEMYYHPGWWRGERFRCRACDNPVFLGQCDMGLVDKTILAKMTPGDDSIYLTDMGGADSMYLCDWEGAEGHDH